MPTAVANMYTTFELDPSELEVATTFNHLQKMYLQNIRYELILERDRIVINYEHPQAYFHTKIQLDGRIDQLTELIELQPEVANQLEE